MGGPRLKKVTATNTRRHKINAPGAERPGKSQKEKKAMEVKYRHAIMTYEWRTRRRG